MTKPKTKIDNSWPDVVIKIRYTKSYHKRCQKLLNVNFPPTSKVWYFAPISRRHQQPHPSLISHSMSSGKPLLVYTVPESPWHVVITDKAQHFYFNSETKASVWQITETDGDLPSKLDYNELAILFAKARGYSSRRESKKVDDHTQKAAEPEAKIPESEAEHEDWQSELEPEEVEVPLDLINDVVQEKGPRIDQKEHAEEERAVVAEKKAPEEASMGAGVDLLQGYSSDESDEEPEAQVEDEAAEETNEAVEDVSAAAGESPEQSDTEPEEAEDSPEPAPLDVNAGLELTLSGDEEEPDSTCTKEEFKDFLSLHLDKFSKFDPWFLVAEELVLLLAQEPAFYGLLDETKEAIFNEWVIGSNESQQSSNQYPTPTLLFFKDLQENKTEIRKLPYPKFVESFPHEITVEEPDKLYRKLRATLVDFAEHEKQLKKGGYKGENLKVKRVREFVAQELSSLAFKKREHEPLAELFFDKWMELCNAFSLPQSMVESPVNFILGDEKRYMCYKEALTE